MSEAGASRSDPPSSFELFCLFQAKTLTFDWSGA